MKTIHIIGIVIVAVAIGIVISTAEDASAYVSFEEAKNIAINNDDKKIHVVGELQKDPAGHVTGIQTSPDKLSFTFMMVDEKGEAQQVYYNEPIPTDFTKSEKVVVVGNYQDNTFVASKILLKCPSKYQENELKEI